MRPRPTRAHDEPLGAARAYVDRDDVDAVVAELEGASAPGTAVARFEVALAHASGAREAVAVASAGAALQLAYHVLGVGPGRDLLTSANVPTAVASAAQLCGGGVEFLDVDARTGNLDVRLLEERLERGPRPHVVTASHFAGLPCDMEWLLALKRRHDFLLVEDAGQALGARYRVDGRWWRVGEHPEVDATVLAFGAAEHVTTGEGGALLVHDPVRAARLRRLRAGGTDPESALQPFEPAPTHAHRPAWFQPMTELGFHCRMTDLAAALGVSQLKKLPDFLAARREIALRYLAELRAYGLPHPGGLGESAEREHAWSLFVIQCVATERDELHAFLRQRGVQALVHHYPLPLEPWFRGRARAHPCPNAIAHARSALSLPLYPSLSDEDQGRVIAALAEWSRLGAVA